MNDDTNNKKINSLDSVNKKIEEYQLKSSGKLSEEGKNTEISSYVRVGFATLTEFFSGIIVSVLIGIALDKYFDSVPIFLILFICIGFVVGIRNIYKYINKEL